MTGPPFWSLFMDAGSIRPTDARPLPTPASAAVAEPARAALPGDRFIRSAGPTDDVAGLSAPKKAWRGLSLAARMLPGAIGGMVRQPGQLLSGLAAPYLHPLRSLHEANAAVKASAAQGPVEAALTAVKRHGGLLAAWGLPVSIALAPFTGGTSLIATAAMAVGAAGIAATGASLAKNTWDAAHAGSEAELEAQSHELLDDGLGLVTAAATAGVGKLLPRAQVRAAAEAPRVEPPVVEVAPAPAGPMAPPAGRLMLDLPSSAKPVARMGIVSAETPLRSEAIVRRALPETPQAMQSAITDEAKFYMANQKNYMDELLREAGFDGLPTVVSEAELDQAVANGERELFRGVSDAAFADQLRDGDLFIGNKNANGSGIFAAYGPDGQTVASRYGSGRGAVVRMALKPDARIIGYKELDQMLKAEKAQDVAETNAMRARFKAQAEAAATPEEAARIKQESQKVLDEHIIRTGFAFGDIGRYAALKGYDAIDMESTKFMNVLNRTALRIQATNAGTVMPKLQH